LIASNAGQQHQRGVPEWRKVELSGSTTARFGFIEEKVEVIVCALLAIEGNGFQSLSEGDQVSFVEVRGAKGPQATQVRKL